MASSRSVVVHAVLWQVLYDPRRQNGGEIGGITVGLFDSGFGGLTVVREVRRQWPNLGII